MSSASSGAVTEISVSTVTSLNKELLARGVRRYQDSRDSRSDRRGSVYEIHLGAGNAPPSTRVDLSTRPRGATASVARSERATPERPRRSFDGERTLP